MAIFLNAQSYLLIAFGVLLLGGVGHLANDVVITYLRKSNSTSVELAVFGLDSFYAFSLIFFGGINLYYILSQQVKSHAYFMILVCFAVVYFVAVTLFMTDKPPRVILSVFGCLVIGAWIAEVFVSAS